VLQDAASGRWTTSTPENAENLKILRKMDHFPSFMNFFIFFSAEKDGRS
jgi:hypothetical protein